MPSMDRHWRWMYGFGFAIGLYFGVVLPLYMIFGHALIDFFYGISSAGALDAITWNSLCSALTLPLMVWGMSSLIRGSRRRERQRNLVLAGQSDAMLPARATPHTDIGSLPDLAREPFQLLWRTRRGTSGVIATSEGLIWRRPRKRDVLVRWSDARLLEVWFLAFGSDNGAGYALIDGLGNVVEWQDYREDKAPPAEDGTTFAEMQLRQQTLLALIIAHTGLQMRTFVLDLAELPAKVSLVPTAPVAHRGGLRRIWHWGTLFMLILAGVPLGVAAAAITLPLTRSLLLNAYVAATIGGLGLFILGFELRIIAESLRDKPPTPLPFVALPPVPPGLLRLTPPLRLRGPSVAGQRIVCLIVALLLAGDGYALIQALIEMPLLNGDALFAPGDLRRVLIGALFVIVLPGIVICGMGLFEQRSVVIVGPDGMHWRRGRKREMLPWQLMTRLVVHFSAGKLERFAVAGDDANTTEISWLVNARWSPRSTTSSPADSDAAELAALVARRTGLALTVEDGV